MTSRTFLGGCVILLAAAAGCYTGGNIPPVDRTGPPEAPASTVESTEPSADAVTGIPCDVAEVLAKDCASCHAAKPSGGAPNAMMSWDDLAAPSLTVPSASVAEVSITRMKDAVNPMPPDGASKADLAILEQWFADGIPKGTEVCDAKPAASVYATPSVCTTKGQWTKADRGSVLMRPGGACVQCHEDKGEGPIYQVGGTVYATAHEPDDCNGTASTAVKVVITDATQKTFTVPVNAAGNFFLDPRTQKITMPYKAKVVSGTKSRAMSAAQTDGDCNKCHTENGTKLKGSKQEAAPGRVMAP
jgi:cytochrome c553